MLLGKTEQTKGEVMEAARRHGTGALQVVIRNQAGTAVTECHKTLCAAWCQRKIAADADVPLSMIDRHIAGKMDLFNDVQRHNWKEVNVDREVLLRAYNSTALGAPTLEVVL